MIKTRALSGNPIVRRYLLALSELDHPGRLVTPPALGAGSALALAVAIAEAGVSEAGADREHAPTFHVLHEGNLGKALHHSVTVHDDGCVVLSDLRYRFD